MSVHRATLRTHRIIRTIASLVIIASVFVAWRFVNFSVIFDYFNARDYDPSEGLTEIIQNLRLTPAGDRIMRGTRAELQDADAFNASCKKASEKIILLGCYSNNHIYIYNIEDRDLNGVREATLAHELLHAVWQRMTEAEREEIRPSLNEVYEQNTELKEHLELYDSTEFFDELHSIVGSQIESEKMPEILQKHYSKYFTNPNVVVGYYHKYNDNLVKANKRLEELEEIMKKAKAEIDSRVAQYNIENSKLADDYAAFNSRVLLRGYTEEEYYERLSELDGRKEKLKIEYAAIQKLSSDYNAYVAEQNKYVIFTQKAYDSMNSTIKKPAEN